MSVGVGIVEFNSKLGLDVSRSIGTEVSGSKVGKEFNLEKEMPRV